MIDFAFKKKINTRRMNQFEEEEDACWNVLDDYNTIINDFDVSQFYLTSPSANATASFSLTGDESAQKGQKRVRKQEKACCETDKSKASRERLRREKMNDRFSELRKFLNPGKLAKSDKSCVLREAICAVYKLKTEHLELKERKKKLKDDTKNLKEEKKELKEEKHKLQTRKRMIEQQIKAITMAPSSTYAIPIPMQMPMLGGGGKGVVVSGYGGGYPMWQWIPPSVLDVSQDHVLRPPVA